MLEQPAPPHLGESRQRSQDQEDADQDLSSDDDGDQDQNLAITSKVITDTYSFSYEEKAKKYKIDYPKGEYMTSLIVFEGKVLFAPLVGERINRAKIELLTTGEDSFHQGSIR